MKEIAEINMVYAPLDEAFPDPFQHHTINPRSQEIISSVESHKYAPILEPPPRAFPDYQPAVEWDAVFTEPTKIVSEPTPNQPELRIQKYTPIIEPVKKTMIEPFVNPMPTKRQEWEELFAQMEQYGKMQGWMKHERSWTIWFQELIPYVLLGVFIIFLLEGIAKLRR